MIFLLLLFPTQISGQLVCNLPAFPTNVNLTKSSDLVSWSPLTGNPPTIENSFHVRVFCPSVGIYVQSQCVDTNLVPSLANLDCTLAMNKQSAPNVRGYWPWLTTDLSGHGRNMVLNINGTSTTQQPINETSLRWIMGFMTKPTGHSSIDPIVSVQYNDGTVLKVFLNSSGTMAKFVVRYSEAIPQQVSHECTDALTPSPTNPNAIFFRLAYTRTSFFFRCNEESMTTASISANFPDIFGSITAVHRPIFLFASVDQLGPFLYFHVRF